jgi:hypothetical protein
MPAILMRQQMRRKIIHEQDCLHEQALVNIVVVVVQQKTSNLQFVTYLQFCCNKKTAKKNKEKGDESQDLKFHDDTHNSANLEKSFTRLALAIIERA